MKINKILKIQFIAILNHLMKLNNVKNTIYSYIIDFVVCSFRSSLFLLIFFVFDSSTLECFIVHISVFIFKTLMKCIYYKIFNCIIF